VVGPVDEMGMRVYEQQPSGGGLPIDPPPLGENCPAYIDERTGVSSERRSEESKASATAPPQVVGRASRVMAPKIRDDRAS